MISDILGSGLSQINNRTLDLIFTNSPDSMSAVIAECPLSRIDIHHPPLSFIFDVNTNIKCSMDNNGYYDFNFYKADFIKLNEYW